ncbi:MAG: hypothetical protein DMD88_09875 [Candidatus Rokuibacteriota bacterium]|nr:MAG: hypothetical protein DMD88_09875 [Candidatus Rokubacteria bacterium]
MIRARLGRCTTLPFGRHSHAPEGVMLVSPATTGVARLLLIVSRMDLARYTYLKLVLDSATADVILDRRAGGRRWRQKRVSAERRRDDRRQQDVTQDLQASGWAMVSR